MDPVRYRILGTTQALRPDGTPVAVGGARLRALLTVLALRAGRTVPAGTLVDEVWAGDPPADATGALQALVGRLRRALGPDAVDSTAGGYRLTAGPDAVDLHRFERLTADGLRALADGDPAKAAGLLDDALALWQGPALADLPDRTAEAARHETRRLDALRARHTAALALGHAAQSLPELTALCDAHPLDEPLQTLRLRALRDTGRPAEALAAYDEVRRLLADRLGSDPGPALRTLHAELLNPEEPPRAEWRTTRPTAPTRPHRWTAPDTPDPDPAAPASGPDRDPRFGAGPGTGTGPGASAGTGSGRSSAAQAPGSDTRFGTGPGSGSRRETGSGRGSAAPAPGSHTGPRFGSGTGTGSGSGFGPGSGRGPSYGSDSGPGSDTDPGFGTGPGSSSGADSGSDTGTGPGSGSGLGSGSGFSPGSGPDSGPGPGSAAPVPGSDTHPGLGTGPGSGFRSSSGSGTGTGSGTETGPGSRPGTGTGPGSGYGPESGSGSGLGPGQGSSPGPGWGTGPGSAAPAPGSDSGTGTGYGPEPGPGWGTGPGPGPGPGLHPGPTEPPVAVALPPDAPGVVAGGAAPAGAPLDGASAPGNLRARLTSFVGREVDIEVIQGDLAGARLVTLLGPGGAGKTRLSQEVGEAVRRHLRDGVWLAELAPVSDPDAVPQAVLTAVGARETVLYGAGAEEMRAVAERHDDPVERLVEHCARRRMLIVLDNCEHVIEAAARLVARLLERCPGLVVLATSREPLGVPGELVRPVEPLPEPVALRLLADRGAAARPGFRTGDDPEACAEICRRLDGLPLAIELAAARLRILTPRQIADRLDDRFRLLTSGSRTVLPRQQTLRAVVDWSWDLLDEDERDVLARLSVFARGCDLAAVEAVCGGGDALDPLSSLASLVDKSLVVAAPAADGAMRYRLLETVAEYAAERLDERGHRPAAERAHLTYYRELARTTEPLLRGSRQLEAIERFQAEYENLRTALRRAVDARDEQEALVLALSLVGYWQMRDLRIEARNWSRAVMELGPDPFTDPVRPAAPVREPVIATPPPLTGEVLQEARRGVHLSHLACMDMELEAWDNPAAQNKLRVVGETYAPGLPQTCRAPGLLWFYAVMLTGDMDRIRVIVDANVETCRATPGYEHELATCLQMRANLLANRSDWAGDAGRDADEALEIFGRLGDSWGAAEAYSARAEASERLGAYREAAVDYQAAMDHAEHLGARHQLAVLGARLGSALLEAGETERGERLLRDVIDSRWGMANEAMPIARLFLAGSLGLNGRLTEAREQLLLLREEFGIAHFVVFDAFILGAEAWLDVLDGRYDSALAAVRKALERAADKLSMTIAPHMRAFYLVIAAAALAGADGGRRAVDAARCLGTADTLLPPHHVAVRLEREAHRLATERARTALGETAFDAAYAEGGGLSYDEAAALV
ncbi:BTAD domain-containing putative transcriptional regulator [Streptomyces sp. CAI-85]|uniref:AfsR/SARP family transcriptional regulator n=1 Tax=Streptomyces sp. CAI-85 TaxID=1472662 RepID=UPI0015879745|nr:BTAD domain-containing putative transcriptional regulator [Streptomyces sp. CAI-85]NUV61666.1 AfsR/SARP family transcriptional regulator [Streptomyces sp. CAI-85]